ncbi:MAG TPA: DUF928 domain-containing protein [Coleofasciculaceae cyanobacterium]
MINRSRFVHRLSSFGLSLTLLLMPQVLPIQPPPAAAFSVPNLRQTWENLWGRLLASEPPVPPSNGGGRGATFCVISPLETAAPATEMARVLSDRPTLTWIGEAGTLEVHQPDQETALWQGRVSDGDRKGTVVLDANSNAALNIYQVAVPKRLEAGQAYTWWVSPSQVQARQISFQVVTAAERDRLMQALQTLNQQLAAEGVTGEKATLRRADFYAQQQLWAEFWREVLAVPHPSAELTQLIDQSFRVFCSGEQ